MATPGTVFLIIGLLFLFIAAILLWVGIDTRDKEISQGKSPNAGWWWIFIGTIILLFGAFSLYLAITLPKKEKVKEAK